MSCFVDIYRDFPLRCARLWDRLRQSDGTATEDLSVTAMLMAAATGLAAPHEQLKVQVGQASKVMKHPAFDPDLKADYEETLKRINSAFDAPVTSGPLFEKIETRNWRLSYCTDFNKIREEAEYGSAQPNSFESSKSRHIVNILRNALSHNNICAFAKKRHGTISDLGFFAEDRQRGEISPRGWHVISTSTDSFAAFLDNWFELLKAEHEGKRPHLRSVLARAFASGDERYAA